MTTEADVKQRLAALRRVLAEATKACPELYPWDGPPPYDRSKPHSLDCKGGCQGTGEVARFPDFRQVCESCQGEATMGSLLHKACNGTGWQVRAGGMAAGLAGLTRAEAYGVYEELDPFLEVDEVNGPFSTDPMPSEAEIDVKALELACQVKGLEVPGATTD